MERFSIELWHCSEQGFGSLDKDWWQASCDGIYHARAETPDVAVANVVAYARRSRRQSGETETKSEWPAFESLLRSVNPKDKV